MTVRMYLSTDASAPVLNGVAGSARAVLKACLVDGYGAQAAAGWAEAFTAANVSVFRAPSGNRHYFRLDDTNGLRADLIGYLTMTDAATGTGPFPVSLASYLVKSSVADASARAWVVVADERTVWFMTQGNTDVTWTSAQMLGFGEFVKARPDWSDLNSFVWGASATTGLGATAFAVTSNGSGNTTGVSSSKAVNDSLSGLSNRRRMGINAGRIEGSYGTSLGGHGSTALVSASTGGLLTSPIGLFSTSNGTGGESYTLLGIFRGIREPMHNKPLANFDTIDGSGDLAGKQFLAVNGGGTGQVFLEISNTWE